MPIMYCVISRGLIVLTKYASCEGNFEEVTEKVLAKISPQNDKMTYSQGPYLFHYISSNNIIYMCITDDVSTLKLSEIYLNHLSKTYPECLKFLGFPKI